MEYHFRKRIKILMKAFEGMLCIKTVRSDLNRIEGDLKSVTCKTTFSTFPINAARSAPVSTAKPGRFVRCTSLKTVTMIRVEGDKHL